MAMAYNFDILRFSDFVLLSLPWAPGCHFLKAVQGSVVGGRYRAEQDSIKWNRINCEDFSKNQLK